MRRTMTILLLGFVLLYLLPIAVAAVGYWSGGGGLDWRTADRSSTGLLPPAEQQAAATVRVFSARTVRWRGIVATHSWIVFKDAGAARYERYDYTAWGEPIRANGFTPDGRWFGAEPELVHAVDGEPAARAIAQIRAAIAAYPFRAVDHYRAWPGPNSNTFVAALLDAAPGLGAVLPNTAIGKDYPHDGRWLSPAQGGLGFRLRLGGYGGLTLGWREGLQLDILGAVAGIDIRRPAIMLPALGRFGFTTN